MLTEIQEGMRVTGETKGLEFPQDSHTYTHVSRHRGQWCYAKLQYQTKWEGKQTLEEDISATHQFQECRSSGKVKSCTCFMWWITSELKTSQILKVNEMDLVSTTIRTAIDIYDEAQHEVEEQLDSNSEDPEDKSNSDARSMPENPQGTNQTIIGNDHFQLGSRLPCQTLKQIEDMAGDNSQLLLFCRQLGQFFTWLTGRRVILSWEHKVCLFLVISITNGGKKWAADHPIPMCQGILSDVVDLNVEQNILWCNPRFYDKEHFDTAIIQVDEQQAIFVRLRFLFTVVFDGTTYYLALVIPMDLSWSNQDRPCDKQLRITRIWPWPASNSIFIHMDTIIWGGLLIKDEASMEGEYLVNTFIDQDLWMRLKPGHTNLIINANI